MTPVKTANGHETVTQKLKLRIFEEKLAPEVGIEPTTNRLTAGRSTAELLRNPRNCALTIFTPPPRSTRKPTTVAKNSNACERMLALLELEMRAAILTADS